VGALLQSVLSQGFEGVLVDLLDGLSTLDLVFQDSCDRDLVNIDSTYTTLGPDGSGWSSIKRVSHIVSCVCVCVGKLVN
jgi:hypothetical protein